MLLLVLGVAVAVLLLGGDDDSSSSSSASGGSEVSCDGRDLEADSEADGTLTGEPQGWCVEVTGGGLVASVTSDDDTTLTVLDEDGDVVIRDDDSGPGVDPWVDVDVDDGSYTLVVDAFGSSRGRRIDYTVAVGRPAEGRGEDTGEGRSAPSVPSVPTTSSRPSTPVDCDDLPEVSIGDEVDGMIEPGEPGRFCLRIEADDTTIEASVTSDDDTTLTVLDEAGEEVAYNDDDAGLDPRVTVTLDEGEYVLEVDRWSMIDDEAEFTLVVEEG